MVGTFGEMRFEKFEKYFGRYIVKEIKTKVSGISRKDDRCLAFVIPGEDGKEVWIKAWKNAVSPVVLEHLESLTKGDGVTFEVETVKGYTNIVGVKDVEKGDPSSQGSGGSGGGYRKYSGGSGKKPTESAEDKHRAFALSYAKDVAIAVANLIGNDPAGVPKAESLLGYDNIITIAKAFAAYLDTGE